MFSKALILAAVIAFVSANGHHEHGHAIPYKFGYSIKDHHGEQHREESGDGGHGVRGSYGFTDGRGIHRQVDYVADHGGFRAQVKTNEPGTANQDPAAVHVISTAPALPAAYGLGYGGLGYGGYGYGAPYGAHHGAAYGAHHGDAYGAHHGDAYGHAGAGLGMGHDGFGYGHGPMAHDGLGYGMGHNAHHVYAQGYAGLGAGAYGGYGYGNAAFGNLGYQRYGY